MYTILVYDISIKRGQKVLKIARKYLTRVQNSIFEGELTDSLYEELKYELRKIIDEEYDSCIFFRFNSKYYFDKEEIGINKGKVENFL